MVLNKNNYKAYAHAHHLRHNWVGRGDFLRDVRLSDKVADEIAKLHNGEGNPRLLINLVITLFNTFAPDAGRKLLFFAVEPKHHPKLRSLLRIVGFDPFDFEVSPEDYCTQFYQTLKEEIAG